MHTVRTATPDDMPHVEALLREMLSHAQQDGAALDEHRARRTLETLRRSPDSEIFVLVDGRDHPVGVLLAVLTPLWWQFGDAASDLGFYVAPGHRGHGMKLFRAYQQWAKEFASVREIYFGVTFGGEQGERSEILAQRLGYQRAGANYVMRIPA